MLAYKVVMVGDFGVGKTSLVKRFVENSFSEEYLSTIGVSISKKSLNNSTIMLWDIEGRTEFKPIFKQYLLGAKGFIVVADISRRDTLDSIKKHIELCHSIVKDAPIAIAINKSDLEHKVSDEDIENLRLISKSIVEVLQTSAKNDQAVGDIFAALDSSIANS